MTSGHKIHVALLLTTCSLMRMIQIKRQWRSQDFFGGGHKSGKRIWTFFIFVIIFARKVLNFPFCGLHMTNVCCRFFKNSILCVWKPYLDRIWILSPNHTCYPLSLRVCPSPYAGARNLIFWESESHFCFMPANSADLF